MILFCHFTESTCILSCQVGVVQIDKLTSSWREQQTASSPINPRKTGRSLRGRNSKHLICQFQSLFHCRHFCCARKHLFCSQAVEHTLENQADFCRAVLQHHFLKKEIFASCIWSVILYRVWKGLLANLSDFFCLKLGLKVRCRWPYEDFSSSLQHHLLICLFYQFNCLTCIIVCFSQKIFVSL